MKNQEIAQMTLSEAQVLRPQRVFGIAGFELLVAARGEGNLKFGIL